MAAKDDSTRKTLTIILVIFVLMSIALGVTTYYGFAGQAALKAKADDAAKKEMARSKERDWERYQRLLLMAYVGAGLSKDEQSTLQSLRQQYDAGQLGKDEANRQSFDTLTKKLAEDLGWDEAKKQPRETYMARVDRLDADVNNYKGQAEKANDLRAKTQDDLEAQLKAKDAEIEETNKALQDTKKQLADQISVKSAEFLKQSKQLEDSEAKNEDLQKQTEVQKDQTKRLAEKKDKTIRELTTQNERLRAETHPASPIDLDQPKAKITALNRSGDLAYIDIGSNEGVQPQLSFSVFGASPSGKAQGERKAAVEVTAVLGPHLSSARVFDVRDPGADPVTVGDLLFNPAWSPGLKQHIAIAGLIDLNGEGRDQTAEFIRNLGRMGITVDAYLDLKDLQIKGSGINQRTSFLVLGEQPELNDEVGALKGEQFNRQKEITEKVGQMQADASSYGVPIVPLRRFLGVIGYPLPKVSENRGNPFRFQPMQGLQRKTESKPSDTNKDDNSDK